MRIEAPTLQEAFQKAAQELGCSVTKIDVERIIQHPSGGIFGLFKKNAIIEVVVEGQSCSKEQACKTDEAKNSVVNEVLPTIKNDVKALVDSSCFAIEVKSVSKYDEQTVLIELDGEDAALLIGKEGRSEERRVGKEC